MVLAARILTGQSKKFAVGFFIGNNFLLLQKLIFRRQLKTNQVHHAKIIILLFYNFIRKRWRSKFGTAAF
jgi:hypothetical protein